MEDKNLLALEISRLKEIIKGLDGQRQLAVRTTLEIKAAERRGAERMLKAIQSLKPASSLDIYNNYVGAIMAAWEAWEAWEKTQDKE